MSIHEKRVGTAEAARLIGKSQSLVRKLCDDGRLPYHQDGPRGKKLIPYNAVLDYDAQTKKAT
jgi:excisionase family DNA binding protein